MSDNHVPNEPDDDDIWAEPSDKADDAAQLELLRILGGSLFDDDDDFEADDDDFETQLDHVELPASLSEREQDERDQAAATDWAEEAERVYEELLERVGEAAPEPRLAATRRACELLGDIHRAWPMIHVTGTNGKTSTARMIESLLDAHGLRAGLLTSPHLMRLNERIVIENEPISDERLVLNWRDIQPYLGLVDAELEGQGEAPLTFFEALTVLAYACFADAPVDVAVVEVGMGGEWDSTNVADGSVAVFTPIALDHAPKLGSTIAEIARTKAGIIKPSAEVVSAKQKPEAEEELRRAAEMQEAIWHAEPADFDVVSDQLAVGGRLISVRGLADTYEDLPLPLAGDYQAHNAALAIAAVESFFGGDRPLDPERVAAGLGQSRSPGRLDLIGTEPSVLVDAAHNPHGAAHLAQAVQETFHFDELILVLGVLADKDVEGIVRPLASVAQRILITESDSPRAIAADELAERVIAAIGEDAAREKRVEVVERDLDAFDLARQEAREREAIALQAGDHRSIGVLITGSITLVGEAMRIALEDGWAAGGGAAPLELGSSDDLPADGAFE